MPASKKPDTLKKKPARFRRKALKRSEEPSKQDKISNTDKINLASTTPSENRVEQPLATGKPASINLPMPVKPQQMPSRRLHSPLVKTTYNTRWVKKVALIAGLAGFIAVSGLAWAYRDQIKIVMLPGSSDPAEPYQLEISPTPLPDEAKLNLISNQLIQEQSTISAAVQSPSASSSAALEAQLQSQGTGELTLTLSSTIKTLEAQGVDVSNLKAYQRKIESSQATDEEQARAWLKEALIHAYELELLHRYYTN